MAAAIGKPNSATNWKKSILYPRKCLTVLSIYDIVMYKLQRQTWYSKIKVG